MEILAIFNAKGGVGKTTSAVNLAACFAAMDQRVVLFDLDAQGNATSSLGLKNAPDIGTYDVITGKAKITDALRPTFMDRLSLIGATRNLATIDVDMALGDTTSGILSRVVQPIADDFDLLILDCSPTFGSMTMNALVSANAVLVPSQLSPYSHDGLIRTWTILARVRQELHPALRVVGVLPTFCDPETLSENQIMRAMQAEFGNLVDEQGIPSDPQLFGAATAAGLPASIFQPDAPAATAYVTLAARLLAVGEGGAGVPLDPARTDGPPARIRRLDEAPPADAELQVAALQRLGAWRTKAEADGVLAANVNVPPVDEGAMQTAAYELPSRDDPDTGGPWDRAGRWSLSVGGVLLIGVLAFLLGWAVGSGRF